MALLYFDDCFLEHDTGRHPERALRLERVMAHLEKIEVTKACRRMPVEAAPIENLHAVHTPEYVQHVRLFAEQGGGRIETDTVVSEKSFEAAIRASGAACDAVSQVMKGVDQSALCLSRPPGHHAIPKSAMGFCLFNNVAVAARYAIQKFDLRSVLIVDWDVHHGNGTQDMFYDDGQVGFLSIHRWPFYPGTGKADETGAAAGLGWTRNIPVEFGTKREEYFSEFTRGLEQIAEKTKPELVLISAGFDAHRLDPIGSLGLETHDFQPLTDHVLDVAQAHAQGRVVSLLEGGYNTDVLPDCVELHLKRLLAAND